MPATDAEHIRSELAAGRIRRVLAVRASRIGDLLLATPALHAFKRRWPRPRLIFLTNTYSRDLLRGNPDIDEAIAFDGRETQLAGAKGRRLAHRLRGRAVDLLLALRPRPELPRFARAAGIPHVFPASDARLGDRSRHVVEQGLDRLRPLGICGDPGPLVLEVGDDDKRAAAALLPGGTGPVVVVHPGCDETLRWKPRRGVRRRVWPVRRWRALLDRLHEVLAARLVVTSGSRVESSWVDRILAGSAAPARHVRRPGLGDLAAVLARADVAISVDTGPLHVATAVARHVVALYGPSPLSYTGPWSPARAVTVLRRDLPCAPCQGRDVRCPRNVCMEEIGVGEVLEAVRSALSAAAPSAAGGPRPGRSSAPAADAGGGCSTRSGSS